MVPFACKSTVSRALVVIGWWSCGGGGDAAGSQPAMLYLLQLMPLQLDNTFPFST